MSISSALSTALTGLAASSRMAEVTASNVSNALTEGYARREVQLSARTLGGTGVGVAIKGITRHVNHVLLQDLRLSTSGQGARDMTAGFLSRVEASVGTPDNPASLSARIADAFFPPFFMPPSMIAPPDDTGEMSDTGGSDTGSTGEAESTGTDGGAAADDCCTAHDGPGCADATIEACVCAQDDLCCSSSWDDVCVSEVASFGCGTC